MSSSKYCPSCFALNHPGEKYCVKCGAPVYRSNEGHQLPVETILHGRYLVGRVLGEGGFGITYLGYDLMLSLVVAVKEYFPKGAANRNLSETVHPVDNASDGVFARGKKRFLNEANVLSKLLDMPSIVNIRDFFEENGTAYIVMDYIDGCNLRDFSLMNGALSFSDVYGLLAPLLGDLKKMHDMGIIHRDISPSNMLLTGNGEVKLIDFGAAVLNGKSVTEDDSLMLKPGYAPPEQYRTQDAQGPWTDVYALCASIYTLICGREPSPSMDRVHSDSMPRPTKCGAQISSAQEAVLIKGLAVDCNKRIRNMDELIKGFENPGKGFGSSLLRRAALPVLAAAGLAAAIFAFAFLPGKEEPGPAGEDNPSPVSDVQRPEIRPKASHRVKETLSPDAHRVNIYSGMDKIENFRPQNILDIGGLVVDVAECYIGNHSIVFLMEWENNSPEPAKIYDWLYVPNKGSLENGVSLEYDNLEYEYPANSSGVIRVEMNMDALCVGGVRQLSGICLYISASIQDNYERLYLTFDLPEPVKIESSASADIYKTIRIGATELECYGVSLIEDYHKGYLLLRQSGVAADYFYITLQKQPVRADDNVIYQNSGDYFYASTYEDGSELYTMCFQYGYSSYTDSMNVSHAETEYPQQLILTLQTDYGDVEDFSAELYFSIDENGFGKISDIIEK